MNLSKMTGREKVVEYKNKVPKKPLVSVCVTTYNHEKFIRQCLDSILNQVTDFDFEILLGEDNSSDNTREICIDYAKKYPNKIRLFLHDRRNVINIGDGPTGRFNFLYNLAKAKGKYIALCEGDDYWTDIKKLQRQIDYMEKHPECTLCFHPVQVIRDDNNDGDDSVYPKLKPKLTTNDLLKCNYIQTNSVMYRRRKKYTDIPVDFMPGDWYLHLYYAQFGNIGYINRIMSVYRHHQGGIWSGSGKNLVGFWSRYGYAHLTLFIRLLEMYGADNEKKKIIFDNISKTTDLILKYSSKKWETIDKFIATYPETSPAIVSALVGRIAEQGRCIEQRDSLIAELQKAYEAKIMEIEDIKSSRLWKTRNKVARVLGKKKV